MIFLLLIIILIFLTLHILYNDQRPPIPIIFSIILLSVISGIRYDVGVDYMTYKDMYERALDASNYTYYIEPFWPVLHGVLHSIGGTFTLWLLIVGFLTISGMVYGMNKLSPYFFLSLIIYVGTDLYIESFNAIRQYLAMSIVFVGTPFIFADKYKSFIICVIIAMTCHFSAGIALLLLFFKRSVKIQVSITILIITAIFGNQFLTNYLLPLLSQFGSYFSILVDTSRNYGNLSMDAHDYIVTTGLKKYVLNAIAILVLCITRKWDKDKLFYVNCLTVCVVLYNVFIQFMEYARLQAYFYMYVTILIPLIIRETRVVVNKIFLVLALFFPILLFTLKSQYTKAYETTIELFNNK